MKGRKALLWARRLTQLSFLGLFFYLFRLTDYTGKDQIAAAVNIFFRWNPLVALSVTLAAKALLALFLPALLLAVLTLLLGRFFCGWVCPLGTLLDAAHKVIPPRGQGVGKGWVKVKYFLLLLISASSLFGLQLVGFFDPFALLLRGFTFAVDPVFNSSVTGIFDTLYKKGPSWVTSLSEPVYEFLKKGVLPYQQSIFSLSLVAFFFLLGIFLLERVQRRFWCKNLCPLGALLALLSRFSPLRRRPGKLCPSCGQCGKLCRFEAFQEDGRFVPERCNLCMECVAKCPQGMISYRLGVPSLQDRVDLSRRAFLGVGLTGVALPLVSRVGWGEKLPRPTLLRPPGALDERLFLQKCVRCGECMKVCIQNGLQPTLLEAGAEGMFTPRLVPRIGYCEYNCNLCGQVCPTGAIPKVPLSEKQRFQIGKSHFDKNRCLPYAKEVPCMVCEEHCPIYDKAIRFHEVNVSDGRGGTFPLRQPYVVEELCIGCGICENKCPLPGEAAIHVLSQRDLREAGNGKYD